MDGVTDTRGRGGDEDGSEVLSVFAAGWSSAPVGMGFRVETESDVPFLRELYGSTRAEELERVDLSDELKQAFVDQQFTAQREQYRKHYPGAAFLVVKRENVPIGRLYIHRTRHEVRLMEVTLLQNLRRQGLGTQLMQRLVDWSDALGLPVTLHVEPFNPAQRLYLRLGFVTEEVRGVYHFMRRDAATPDPATPATAG